MIWPATARPGPGRAGVARLWRGVGGGRGGLRSAFFSLFSLCSASLERVCSAFVDPEADVAGRGLVAAGVPDLGDEVKPAAAADVGRDRVVPAGAALERSADIIPISPVSAWGLVMKEAGLRASGFRLRPAGYAGQVALGFRLRLRLWRTRRRTSGWNRSSGRRISPPRRAQRDEGERTVTRPRGPGPLGQAPTGQACTPRQGPRGPAGRRPAKRACRAYPTASNGFLGRQHMEDGACRGVKSAAEVI